jgi:hypothetical protein
MLWLFQVKIMEHGVDLVVEHFLASPDGHVVIGGVAGLLVAASLVEVLLLTFLKDLNTYMSLIFSSNIDIYIGEKTWFTYWAFVL